MRSKRYAFLMVALCATQLYASAVTPVDLVGAEKHIALNKGTDSISESNLSEKDFFNPTYGTERVTLTDSEVVDDSLRLQTLINQVEVAGGGVITVQKGTYYLANIELKSNVHIVIEEGTVLKAYAPELIPDATKEDPYPKFYMFKMGFDENPGQDESIHNVSITCTTEAGYTIDLTGTPHYTMSAFKVAEVSNFQISDVCIQEKYSKFSAITVGAVDHPTAYGVFKNIKSYDNFYGYGLFQLQSGNHLYFENIYGKGGATLRLESGTSDGLLNPPILDQIYARGVICEEGKTAFMIGPHEVDHGHFDVRGISAYSSGFAVNLGKGFGARAGSFAETSFISDIKAVYGESSQLKTKDIKHMPYAQQMMVKRIDIQNPVAEETYRGPSVTAVIDQANYTIQYEPEAIICEGFKETSTGERLPAVLRIK